MKKPASFKSCIFIMADGARADVFEELLNRGYMSNISEYIIKDGTYGKAISVFPSTTGPAYAPFLLGKFPGRCNLPGIRWFDRRVYARKLFSLYRSRSYVGLEGFLMNYDIPKEIKTIFEIVPRSVSILNELSRGISFGGDKTRFLRIYYKIKSHFTDRCDEVDLAARDILINSLKQRPQFAYVVFLGIDTYSHLYHPFHNKVLESYLRIDETVGLIVKALKTQGGLDETLIVITSDHGLTQTHSHFDMLGFLDNLGFKTFYYPNIFKHYADANAANMVSGNAMSHIYIKGQDGWERKRAFEELSELVDALLERPEVDIVAGVDEMGRARIKSEKGEAITWIDDEGYIRYETVSGDPFGYTTLPSKMSTDEILRYSFYSNYPDAPLQIIQLLESPRSGDLVVSAKHGFDLRARHEKPEHRSSHGALFKEHIVVPLCINTRLSREFIRTVDLYPTILTLLGFDFPHGIDGVNLAD
ncbi:MAG: hypothetical protein KatS3mg078_2146 [Deltaproteobacteria bacterium]|jgi:hypothetical protein|nr:MAG: hypothetical protein KatS3mg078_2146 [Deltaproteobacteria bacterium]